MPIENNTIETIRKGIVNAPISNDSTSENGLVIEIINAGKMTETKLKSTIEIVQIKTIDGVLEVISDRETKYFTSEGYFRLHDVGYFDGILGSHGVLALAVVGMQSRSALPDDVLVDIAGRGVKVVTIGRHIESDRICQVIYDNKQGVHLAIDHLLEQKPEQLWLFGHKLTRNDELIDPLGRIDEALQYLSQVRPSLKKRILDLGDRPLVEAGNIVSETLVSRGKPDAVFCSTDWLAWETIHSLRESGLTVGKDVMVVGFNNDMLSRYIQPALTSVDIPYEDYCK